MTADAETFEISFQQEALWLAEPDGPSGRVQALLAIEGPLDEAALAAAVARTVERHEILRTTFVPRPGIRVPLQAVADELTPAWSVVDASDPGEAEQMVVLDRIAAAELEAPIDVACGPLGRTVLVTCGERRHVLVLTFSALVADAATVQTLAHELVHHLGGSQAIADDPLQYADFAAWQREPREAGDPEVAAAADFWTQAGDACAPALPFTTPSAAVGAMATWISPSPRRPETGSRLKRNAMAPRWPTRSRPPGMSSWHAAPVRTRRRWPPCSPSAATRTSPEPSVRSRCRCRSARGSTRR